MPGFPLPPLGIALVTVPWILPVWAIIMFRGGHPATTTQSIPLFIQRKRVPSYTIKQATDCLETLSTLH
jgi:hypothetical protein